MLQFLSQRISEQDYVSAIKEEISKVVKLQEELDIDVLVHGEPEVSLIRSIKLSKYATSLIFLSYFLGKINMSLTYVPSNINPTL